MNSSTSNLPVIFNYEGKQVRSVKIDGEIWLVAKDVCEILEITNHTSIILKKEDLQQTLDWEKTNPIAKSVARSIDIRNYINDLNSILDLVRECAPDDFNDFFRHYDEVRVECPF